jgi:hypothetical protein
MSFHRKQRNEIAQAMRLARPFIIDSPEPQDAKNAVAWRWARDTYINCCEQLAEIIAQTTGSFTAEERQIFLSNCRAIKIEPFTCGTCGQKITDGKPCGHGQRDALGIV